MDKSHVEYIGKIAPEARGKTMLFGHWLNQREIPDHIVRAKKLSIQFMTSLNRRAKNGLGLWPSKSGN